MKSKIKNLIFILILGSVCVGLLLGMRGYTLPIIERTQEIKLKATILEAAGIEYTDENLDDLFKTAIKEVTKDGFKYYLNPDGLYIFEFVGRGLWGMIEGVMTLDPDLETIECMKIISQEETPGLGGRIGEEAFLEGFKKKIFAPKLALASTGKATEPNEIDVITGATMTSEALMDILNEAVENFRKTIGVRHDTITN